MMATNQPELCWMCGHPGRPYMKGVLCDEHAKAQGIEPTGEKMSFGGKTEAVQPEPEATEAEVLEGPWTATVQGNYERISVTFKHGPGYDEPWVVFKGHTVDEVGQLIEEFRTPAADGVTPFQAVAMLAAEFKGAKSLQDTARAAVEQSMGATQDVQQQPAQSAPVQNKTLCDKCNAPAEFKSGVSNKSGKPYKMWKCTANSDHVRFVN